MDGFGRSTASIVFLLALVLGGCAARKDGGSSASSAGQSSGDSSSSSSSSQSDPGPEPGPDPNPKPNPNPNPPAGTTSYDLPTVGSDLHQADQWEGRIASNCGDHDLAADCLTLSYDVYEQTDGGRTSIGNPGSSYDGYESCEVTDLQPPPKTRIRVGTDVQVTVECTGSDNGDDNGDGNGDGDGSDESPSDPNTSP